MINTFIPNRNLLSTLKNTIEFLKKEKRINICILDQCSTYPPLLEYYKTLTDVTIYYFNQNHGPHSVWNEEIKYLHNDEKFIIADPDCIYDEVPDDWLDIMLNVLENPEYNKVGFSLKINDLPNTPLGIQFKESESKFWINKVSEGWIADIDTTFALYRKNSGFLYQAIRLDIPYCIQHYPWYITKDNISEEWIYYINNSNYISTISNTIKEILIDN